MQFGRKSVIFLNYSRACDFLLNIFQEIISVLFYRFSAVYHWNCIFWMPKSKQKTCFFTSLQVYPILKCIHCIIGGIDSGARWYQWRDSGTVNGVLLVILPYTLVILQWQQTNIIDPCSASEILQATVEYKSQNIIIINIKKGPQCKAGRDWLTNYKSEEPSHTIPAHRQ